MTDHLPSVIQCPACHRTQGAPSHGRPIDCMFCGERIDPQRAAPPSASQFSQIGDPARAVVIPVSDAFEYGSPDLASYRWWNPRAALGLAGSFLYTAFVIFFLYVSFWGRTDPSQSWLNWLIAAAVGFSMLVTLYRLAAMLINRTTLRLENDSLLVRHIPLPWVGSGHRLPIKHIQRISVASRRAGGRSRAIRHVLIAETPQGPVILIPELSSPEVGSQLAQTLNSRLDIRE